MSADTERFVQIERIARIQARVRDLHGFDGGEALRIVIETELVEAAREACQRCKKQAFELAKRVPANSSGSPRPVPIPESAHRKSADSQAPTPVFSPRPAIEQPLNPRRKS